MIPYLLTAIGGYLIGSSVKQYASGGQVKLLAPNGKPSNLSPEQYKLVRTPEFKAWFGDWENDPENASKVVDWNGEPQICYHGSGTKFKRFSKIMQGSKVDRKISGYYFTDNEDVAYTYTWDDYKERYMGKKYVRAFFLNIRNPKIIDVRNKKFGEPTYWNDKYDKQISQAKEKYDGVILKNIIDTLQGSVKKMSDFEFSGDTYVVFEQNKMKLADGRNTTFDGSNPDIRYKEGGRIEVYFDENDKRIKEIWKAAKEAFVNAGFDVSNGGFSRTDFGNSAYLYVNYENKSSEDIKVRISDHTVTNKDRILNELHIYKLSDIPKTIQALENILKPKSFDAVEKKQEKIIERVVIVGKPKKYDVIDNFYNPATDTIIEDLGNSAKGNKKYLVKRVKIF